MGSLARPSGLGACAEVLEFGTGEHRAVVTLNRRHFVGCIRTGPSTPASSSAPSTPDYGSSPANAFEYYGRTASQGSEVHVHAS
jgi:hypothetical protein